MEQEELNGEIVFEVMKVNIHQLRLHPTSLKIYDYSSKRDIKVLAKTMNLSGQLEPIIINQNYQIVSGNRRYKAALTLGWDKIDVILRNFNSDEEIVSIVYHNQQRKKKPSEIINEAEAILGILGKSQGSRKDLYKEDKKNPFGVIGKDRFEKAASVIGDISASTLRRIMKVVEFEKQSPENKSFGIVEKIINKELTPSRAETLMKNVIDEKTKREIRKEIKIKSNYSKDNLQLFNKSSDNMSEVKPNSVQVVFTSPPYYNLRNYGNSTKTKLELGLENSPQEFIINLSKHLKDVKRVLKTTGSFFLNIGETYRKNENLLIPNRLIINLCDNEGWFLINEII